MESKDAFSMTIRPLDEQVAILRHVFPEASMPDLDFPLRCQVPDGADGWFATIGYQRGVDPGMFLRVVIDRIGERLGLKNDLGLLTDGSQYLYGGLVELMCSMTRHMQGDPDIVLFPGQFGGRHPERCVRDTRNFRMKKNEEFLLGVPDVLCMLLTHPERLATIDAPALVCGGDAAAPRAASSGNLIPVLSRAYDGALLLTGIRETDTATVLSTPSGFAPLYAEAIVNA